MDAYMRGTQEQKYPDSVALIRDTLAAGLEDALPRLEMVS
jgi:hypothetical protein